MNPRICFASSSETVTFVPFLEYSVTVLVSLADDFFAQKVHAAHNARHKLLIQQMTPAVDQPAEFHCATPCSPFGIVAQVNLYS